MLWYSTEVNSYLKLEEASTHKSANTHAGWLPVDSAFYPPWDGKMTTSQKAVMLCDWGVKAGMM